MNEFKIKNGLIVSGSAEITNNLTVNGRLTAEEYHVSFVSSSVLYESGSTKFGDSSDDTHLFTGSIKISGSILLNGTTVGTGKLDETTFESFTSSYLDVSSSLDERVGDLESFSSSLDNSFVSETEFGSHTSSINGRVNSLETESGSIRGDFNSFTSSYTDVSTSIDSRLDTLETLSGSFTGSFSGSFTGDGTNLYNIPASGVTGLNLTQIADGSVTASVSNTNGLRVNSKTEITGSLIVTDGITGSIDYSNITNKPTLVSGSEQVDITGTTGYSTFSSSISSSIGELSSSVAITTNDLDSRLDNIETSTGSLNSFTSSINTTIKDKLDTEDVISGSVQVTIGDTTGFSTFSSSIATTDSNQNTRLGLIETSTGSLNTFTSSASDRLTSIETSTGSLNTFSSSLLTRVTSIESTTSSLNTFTSSINGAVEVTGSNLTVKGDLLVKGTTTQIDSTTINIGDNIIQLNGTGATNAGLVVRDDTSPNTASGSLLWDTTNDEWVAGVLGSEERIILETEFTDLSSSVLSRVNSLEISSGSIRGDFNIYTGSNNTVIGTLQTSTSSLNTFTSSIGTTIKNKLNSEDVISGSAQVNLPDVTGYSTFSSSISSSIGELSSSVATTTNNLDGRLDNVETSTGSLNDFTSSINTTIKNKLNTENVISGSVQVNITGTTGYSTFSSSVSTSIGTLSSSIATTDSNQNTRLTTIEGRYATTGSNTFVGQEIISGSITLSPSVITIDDNISGSHIYSKGSEGIYFTQNYNGLSSDIELRWLEGNLYTGLLHGGVISATNGGTTFNISAGKGIIVNLNATTTSSPQPTIIEVEWDTFSGQTITNIATNIQTFLGIDSSGEIIQQVTPFTSAQFNNSISLGTVLHQNLTTVNGSTNYPNVAYGYKQRTYDFVKAFGPLKLSGLELFTSGSSTGSLIVSTGTAYAEGRNYSVDPNNPSYITDSGTNVSKIFRYHQVSGTTFVQDTNGGSGYTSIDTLQYNNGGTLTTVPDNEWTTQRVFWFPNSSTKAILVYYGNKTYTTSAEAIANLPYEAFTEVANTQQNAVYLGSLVVKKGADFTNTSTYQILPGGLFRNLGGTGGGGTTVTNRLSDLSDVDVTTATNGQLFVYNASSDKWYGSSNVTASLFGNASTATKLQNVRTINGTSFDGTQDIVIPNLVSGSEQINITGTTGYSTFSSSISTSIGSLSSSIATTDNNQDGRIGSLEIMTGSLSDATSSIQGRLNSIETSTGSLNTYTSSNNTIIGTLQISTSSLNTYTSSNNTVIGTLQTSTGSLNTFTSSAGGRLTSLESASSSIRSDFNTFTSSNSTIESTQNGRLSSLETASGSIRGDFNTFTSSVNGTNSTQDGRLTSIESKTGSIELLNTYTGSNNTVIGTLQTATSSLNTFSSSINGAIEVTGSNLTIKGNLLVKGTSTQVDSTTVSIGDNIIQLNGTGATNAGLVVRDATAPGTVSGSLLWDTLNDKWIAGTLGSEDDVVLRTASQTLTNKTISGASNTLSNIANASLTNSSITIGSTSTSLGSTSTSLAGLTSVTSTAFTGSLQGNISGNSTNITAFTINQNVGSGSQPTFAALYMAGPVIMNNSTSPNSNYLQFGDNTGWIYRFVTNVSGTPTTRFSFKDNGDFTSVGLIAGSNFSGTSSGTNTGDETLARINALAITTVGTITGGTWNGTTIAVANGGTGATTAAAARTNLGATTVGGNLFTLTNPSAISFPRINADNTVSALSAADFRTAIGAGTSSTVGTVTSVGGTGTVSGLSLSGTVTASGNLTLGGTLSVTPSNFASQTANTFLSAPNGSAGTPTFRTIVAADIPTLNQSTTGNAATSTTFSTSRTNYKGVTDAAVAGQLMWKNYGNNHTIFDASNATAPDGTAVNAYNPTNQVENLSSSNSWGMAPTLMGWNGTSTYGVKVDYARFANTAGNITAYTINQSVGTGNSPTFAGLTVNGNVTLGSTSGHYTRINDTLYLGASDSGDSHFYFGEDSSSWYGSYWYWDSQFTHYWYSRHAGTNTVLMYHDTRETTNVYFQRHILPNSNNSYNLGSASLGWANVYTNDLHLSNMNKPGGNDIDGTSGTWTIQEGSENLYIINNRNNKKFKISLEEIL